jgi:hypothetical protein
MIIYICTVQIEGACLRVGLLKRRLHGVSVKNNGRTLPSVFRWLLVLICRICSSPSSLDTKAMFAEGQIPIISSPRARFVA